MIGAVWLWGPETVRSIRPGGRGGGPPVQPIPLDTSETPAEDTIEQATAEGIDPEQDKHSPSWAVDHHTVERTDVGVSVTTTIKRGQGTRDEDKHRIKVKAETVAAATQQLAELKAYLTEEYADEIRALQPSADE